MIGESFGRYRIVAPLGRGGMATVWRAEDPLLGREVAIKVIAEGISRSPAARTRFLTEAENGRRLEHPGIVPVLDAAGEGGPLWIAFELVDGETLADRIARAPMDPAEAARNVAAAADAIAHAHERGVLHRDVTSRNLMIGRDGRVFVLDFGLSRALDADTFTSSGTVIGTLSFLSPEVARGGRAGPAADVWGLGVVLYEALTGRLPFRGERNEALLYAILNDPIVPASVARPELAAEWNVPVAAALTRESEQRPTAAALAAALRSVAARVPAGGAARPGPGGPAAREVSRVFVAVLPFEDAGAAATGQPELGRSLAAAISSALASREGLTVIDAGDATAPAAGSLEAIARAIGANRVLSGEVRRSGADVRVTWRLVDPFTRVQVVGGTVDGRVVDAFGLEDRVIESIVRALNLPAGSGDRTQPRRDPAARERYQQAVGYLQRHDHAPSVDGAITILERLVASEGETAELLGALGRAYLLKRRLTHERVWEARAASACERALAIDPESPDVRLTLAELQLETGQHEAALRAFEQVLDSRPSLDAWIGKGRALEALGRMVEAEQTLKQAIATEPAAWNGHQWLGLHYFHLGRYEEAIVAWRAALERSPNNARTLANLGAAWFQVGNYDETIKACHRSIRSQPTARAYSNLGTALVYSGRVDEGIAALEKAVALDPGEPMYWGNLGSSCRLLSERSARGREATERAILLMRDRLVASMSARRLALLGVWYSNLQRYEEASEAIEAAVRSAPEDLEVLLSAVRAYQISNTSRAILFLRRCMQQGYGLAGIEADPALAPLRSHPEYVLAAAEHEPGGEPC